MENIDVMVLRALTQWRTSGKRALLATVIRTWGSSPRPVGSIMALCENGAVVGSVSGGCIEDDLIDHYTKAYQRASAGLREKSADAGQHGQSADSKAHSLDARQSGLNEIPSGPPQTIKYGVTADEAHRFGLPCGGTLELLLEFDPDPHALNTLTLALAKGQLMQRSVQLASGTVELTPCDAPAELIIDANYLRNTFGPEFRMVLIGAGQMAEYLSTMAKFSGFSVYVCDPREEYSQNWSVQGVNLLKQMPDDAVKALKPDQRTCVIALTHDPKLDDLAILEALESEAFYVGAIGSRRNNAARKERLQEHFDISTQNIERLKGPIGLYIGSKTPAEIAVSIMAEVLAVKNKVPIAKEHVVMHAKNSQHI